MENVWALSLTLLVLWLFGMVSLHADGFIYVSPLFCRARICGTYDTKRPPARHQLANARGFAESNSSRWCFRPVMQLTRSAVKDRHKSRRIDAPTG